jgi:hypothetical protein
MPIIRTGTKFNTRKENAQREELADKKKTREFSSINIQQSAK